MEADLVSHGRDSAAGSFVHTLTTLTDVASGWTECVALVVRDGRSSRRRWSNAHKHGLSAGLNRRVALRKNFIVAVSTSHRVCSFGEPERQVRVYNSATSRRSRSEQRCCLIARLSADAAPYQRGYDRHRGRPRFQSVLALDAFMEFVIVRFPTLRGVNVDGAPQ